MYMHAVCIRLLGVELLPVTYVYVLDVVSNDPCSQSSVPHVKKMKFSTREKSMHHYCCQNENNLPHKLFHSIVFLFMCIIYLSNGLGTIAVFCPCNTIIEKISIFPIYHLHSWKCVGCCLQVDPCSQSSATLALSCCQSSCTSQCYNNARMKECSCTEKKEQVHTTQSQITLTQN